MKLENTTAPGAGSHFVSEANKNPLKTVSSKRGAKTLVTASRDPTATGSSDLINGKTPSIVPAS
jgi:hypothetical protein